MFLFRYQWFGKLIYVQNIIYNQKQMTLFSKFIAFWHSWITTKIFKDDRTNNLTWNLLPMIFLTNIVLNLQKRRPGATKLRMNACLLQFQTHAYDNMIDSFKVCTFFHDIVLVYFIAPWPLSFFHRSLAIHLTLPLTYKNYWIH